MSAPQKRKSPIMFETLSSMRRKKRQETLSKFNITPQEYRNVVHFCNIASIQPILENFISRLEWFELERLVIALQKTIALGARNETIATCQHALNILIRELDGQQFISGHAPPRQYPVLLDRNQEWLRELDADFQSDAEAKATSTFYERINEIFERILDIRIEETYNTTFHHEPINQIFLEILQCSLRANRMQLSQQDFPALIQYIAYAPTDDNDDGMNTIPFRIPCDLAFSDPNYIVQFVEFVLSSVNRYDMSTRSEENISYGPQTPQIHLRLSDGTVVSRDMLYHVFWFNPQITHNGSDVNIHSTIPDDINTGRTNRVWIAANNPFISQDMYVSSIQLNKRHYDQVSPFNIERWDTISSPDDPFGSKYAVSTKSSVYGSITRTSVMFFLQFQSEPTLHEISETLHYCPLKLVNKHVAFAQDHAQQINDFTLVSLKTIREQQNTCFSHPRNKQQYNDLIHLLENNNSVGKSDLTGTGKTTTLIISDTGVSKDDEEEEEEDDPLSNIMISQNIPTGWTLDNNFFTAPHYYVVTPIHFHSIQIQPTHSISNDMLYGLDQWDWRFEYTHPDSITGQTYTIPKGQYVTQNGILHVNSNTFKGFNTRPNTSLLHIDWEALGPNRTLFTNINNPSNHMTPLSRGPDSNNATTTTTHNTSDIMENPVLNIVVEISLSLVMLATPQFIVDHYGIQVLRSLLYHYFKILHTLPLALSNTDSTLYYVADEEFAESSARHLDCTIKQYQEKFEYLLETMMDVLKETTQNTTDMSSTYNPLQIQVEMDHVAKNMSKHNNMLLTQFYSEWNVLFSDSRRDIEHLITKHFEKDDEHLESLPPYTFFFSMKQIGKYNRNEDDGEDGDSFGHSFMPFIHRGARIIFIESMWLETSLYITYHNPTGKFRILDNFNIVQDISIPDEWTRDTNNTQLIECALNHILSQYITWWQDNSRMVLHNPIIHRHIYWSPDTLNRISQAMFVSNQRFNAQDYRAISLQYDDFSLDMQRILSIEASPRIHSHMLICLGCASNLENLPRTVLDTLFNHRVVTQSSS